MDSHRDGGESSRVCPAPVKLPAKPCPGEGGRWFQLTHAYFTIRDLGATLKTKVTIAQWLRFTEARF